MYIWPLMNIYMFVTWILLSIKKLGNSSLRHESLIFAPFKDQGSIHSVRTHTNQFIHVHI